MNRKALEDLEAMDGGELVKVLTGAAWNARRKGAAAGAPWALTMTADKIEDITGSAYIILRDMIDADESESPLPLLIWRAITSAAQREYRASSRTVSSTAETGETWIDGTTDGPEESTTTRAAIMGAAEKAGAVELVKLIEAGYSINEAAQLAGVPKSSAYRIMSRLRKELEKAL